jgi:cell division septation protein DedD
VDIAGYIQDLLWDYECVIVPGFGGILATYRPAEMVLAEHTIYPPSKSLAFNEYLANNDGLLINHICHKEQISYSDAADAVEVWVKKTKLLLGNNEEIYLPKIGRLQKDIEKNLRFAPDTSVNYLAAAYALRKVVAAPVLRGRSADTIETIPLHRASYALPRANKTWAMAAVIILFLALGTVAGLMYQGVDVPPLNLNAAGVLSVLEDFHKQPEPAPELKPSINKEIPVLMPETQWPVARLQPREVNTTANVPVEPVDNATAGNATAPVVATEPSGVASATGKKYYVIIGAYERRANFRNAEAYLRDKHPNEELYEDTSLEKKRIGFYAGDNYEEALTKLQEARKDRQDYWLLVKK